MFRELLTDNLDISDDKINELMDAIPALLKSKLQAVKNYRTWMPELLQILNFQGV